MSTTLLSAADVATELDCDPVTVRRAAGANGVGQQISGRWIFTQDDIPRLRAVIRESKGNPNFSPGNYFGGAKKPPKKRRKK